MICSSPGRIASLIAMLGLLLIQTVGLAGPAFKSTSSKSGGSSYYTPSNAFPVFTTPVYAVPMTVPATTAANTARLNIRLPEKARLWIEGREVSLTGSNRHLISPPLEPGYDYTYHLRVEWVENGETMVQVHNVAVHAGDVINLDAAHWPVTPMER